MASEVHFNSLFSMYFLMISIRAIYNFNLDLFYFDGIIIYEFNLFI